MRFTIFLFVFGIETTKIIFFRDKFSYWDFLPMYRDSSHNSFHLREIFPLVMLALQVDLLFSLECEDKGKVIAFQDR
jgi:hypothetical protein